MKFTRKVTSALIALILLVPGATTPASSQTTLVRTEPEQPQTIIDPKVADTVDTGAGRVGQRQSRDELARVTNGQPLARIDSRIGNRVQSRVRNRLDRNYHPTANATSPFEVAEQRSTRVNGHR